MGIGSQIVLYTRESDRFPEKTSFLLLDSFLQKSFKWLE